MVITGSHDRLVTRLLPDGSAVLGCVMKRSFDLTAPGRPRTVALVDEPSYAGPAGARELIAEPDELAVARAGADVVVHGHVFAPGGAEHVDAVVQVGTARKTVRGHGDRLIERRRHGHLAFSRTEPFERIPLTYRRSYGGRDLDAEARMRLEPDECLSYPRNAIGRCYVVGGGDARIDGMLAPNFEDPDDPVTIGRIRREDPDDWLDAPVAAGFGPIDPFTFPRAALIFPMAHRRPRRAVMEVTAGDLTAADLADRSPLGSPTDSRAFSCGSSRLRFLALRGDEEVVLRHLCPDSTTLTTRLPDARVAVTLAPPGCPPRRLAAGLRHVELRPTEGTMTLTYAAAMPVAAVFPPDVMERVGIDVHWA